MPWSGISPRPATAFQANSRLTAPCLSADTILHIISRDKEKQPHTRRVFWMRVAPNALTAPDKSALGRGWGALGEGWRERLFSLRCEKAGPSRAGGDRKAARRAVSVTTQEVTGIGSNARDPPSPQTKANSANSP